MVVQTALPLCDQPHIVEERSCPFLLALISALISAWSQILSQWQISKHLLSHDGVLVVSSGATEPSTRSCLQGVIGRRLKLFLLTKPTHGPTTEPPAARTPITWQLFGGSVGSGKLVQNLDRFIKLTGNSWKIVSIKDGSEG